MDREVLPTRRSGITQKLTVGDATFYLRTGEYPDGRLGEIFLDAHRQSSSFRSVLNALAIAVSIGLQHGVPLEEFVDAFTFTKFDPSGPVSSHKRLKFCSSVLDLIFRDLAIAYLGRDDLAHVAKEEAASDGEAPETSEPQTGISKNRQDIRTQSGQVYDGTACIECGNFTLRRSGTCLTCDTCGRSSGCV